MSASCLSYPLRIANSYSPHSRITGETLGRLLRWLWSLVFPSRNQGDNLPSSLSIQYDFVDPGPVRPRELSCGELICLTGYHIPYLKVLEVEEGAKGSDFTLPSPASRTA